MRPTPRTGPTGDDGAVLLIALLFLGVVAVLITSVLGLTATNLSSVTVTRELAAKQYAADAGLKYAVQQLRSNPEYCRNDLIAPPAELLGAAAENTARPTVTVTCEVTNLAELNAARRYALITMDDDADGLQAKVPAGERVAVSGPVHLASTPDPLPFQVSDGNVWVKTPTSGTCPNQPDKLQLETPPHDYDCVSGPVPDPAPALPASQPPLVVSGLPYMVTAGDCAVFRPGTYRPPYLKSIIDPATLLVTGDPLTSLASPFEDFDQVFLAPGLYYFENTDLILTKQDLFGGDLGTAGESGATPCSTSTLNGGVPGTNGTGVTVILGGSSRLVADNPGGRIELLNREGVPAGPTDDISVMTVTAKAAGDAGWGVPSPVDYCSVRVGVTNIGAGDLSSCTLQPGGSGSTDQAFVAHGLVYVPGGQVIIRNNKTPTKFLGSLVVGRLVIGTSTHIGGFAISVPGINVPRKMRVVVTATGRGGSDAPVVAASELEVDDATDTAIVKSRFSGQD